VARWNAEDRREGFANMLDFIGDNRECPELSPDDTFMDGVPRGPTDSTGLASDGKRLGAEKKS
jgi:hypothetical protein